MDQVLSRQQTDLVALERRLVLQARDALAGAAGPRADLERLTRLVTEMDELFLLVVAGDPQRLFAVTPDGIAEVPRQGAGR